jgi:hypothetical protein
MKIKFDIEASPEELRRFFGLPDITPLQEEMINIVKQNMRNGMDGFDPATLLKPWLPTHMQNMEAVQKAFWGAFTPTENSTDKRE